MRAWISLIASMTALLLSGCALPAAELRGDSAPASASSPPADVAPPGAPPPADLPAPVPPPATSAAGPAAQPVPPVAAPLLRAGSGGDGDSWKDTTGREYRLGMVNAPETGECFGSEATAERKALIADGFRANAYARDTYGRSVSVVTTASGLNVNVHLARRGFVDDRYLAQFRSENPSLAAELDQAFAAAKAGREGLWGRCGSAAAAARNTAPSRSPAPVQPLVAAPKSGCHADYVTCVAVKGNGSGSGEANDLDCGDIGKKVELREPGADPYRLDANNDGYGCESYG